MLAKTLIATLTMCVIGVAVANNSPVFLWGTNSPSKPALQTVSQQEFAELAEPLLKSSMVVAFLEENLSSNDFICSNAESSTSCYAHLQGVLPKTYYASVENPIEALRSLATEREFNSVDKQGKLETPLACAAGKVVFVNFDSVKEERAAVLESHDAAIAAISKDISCPIVYMYMSAPQNSPANTAQRRVRRDTAAPNGGYMFRQNSQFLLFFTKLILNTQIGNNEMVVDSMTITNGTDNGASLFTVTLNIGAQPLNFNISLAGGYFTLSNVVYDGITYRSTGIDSPTDFSYYCGNLTLGAIAPSLTATASGNTLQFNSLQFQAPFGSTTNPNFVFGDAWHCVGFFTPGILMGLFVIIIMLLITFMGIAWMMDIKTMDRFDDPKGKTITINTTD